MKQILPILFIAIPAIGLAQHKNSGGKILNKKYIDQTVQQLMQSGDVDGLSIGFVYEGKPAYIKSWGYKNAAKDQPIDTATCFYAASLAKPLFTYLVMQIVDEGKIELDKPLHTYLPKPLPEYPDYQDLKGDDRWKLITARHCMSHTTGFPNWRVLNPKNNNKLEIFFTPGERYAYSGEGLVLLQKVIEHITGKGLETLAQEKIFQPGGMYRTSFVWQPEFENNYAIGFNEDGRPVEKNKRTDANAAGSMETTIADYTRFMAMVMQQKELSKERWNEIFTPQIAIYSRQQFPSLTYDSTDKYRSIELSYGLGWGLFNSPYGKIFFKEGHDNGWEHYTIGFLNTREVIVIMTNSSNGESIFKELVEKLTGVTIPWEWEGYYPARQSVKLPAAYLNTLTGMYENPGFKVSIGFQDEHLTMESKDAQIPLSNLYAIDKEHFFLRFVDAQIRFIKNDQGVVDTMEVTHDGDKYTFKRKM